MKRRSFLSLLGAAGSAQAWPSLGVTSVPVAVSYNRYMYGLAVFRARTRASISATDLMMRLKVSALQADAMMSEMTADGLVTPVTNAAGQTMRALDPQYARPLEHPKTLLSKAAEWLEDQGEIIEPAAATDESKTYVPYVGQEKDYG